MIFKDIKTSKISSISDYFTMPISWMRSLILMILVSLASSFSIKRCVEITDIEIEGYPPIDSRLTEIKSEEVEAFRNFLLKSEAPVARVFSSNNYKIKSFDCTIEYFNVFDISSQLGNVYSLLEESYSMLIDKMIDLKIMKKARIDLESMMYEASTNRFVLVDVLDIMESSVYTKGADLLKTEMKYELNSFLESLKKLNDKNKKVITSDEELEVELTRIPKSENGQPKFSNSRIFFDEFEESYTASNSDPKRKIRKIVDNFSNSSNEQPQSTLKISMEKNDKNFGVRVLINDTLSKSIELSKKEHLYFFYLCRHNERRFQECKPVINIDLTPGNELVLSIENQSKIDVEIHSDYIYEINPEVPSRSMNMLSNKNYNPKDNNQIYSHQIYLTVVPQQTPGLVSIRVIFSLEEIDRKTKRIFFCVDESYQLRFKEDKLNSPNEKFKILGKINQAIQIPEGLGLVQVPYVEEVQNECHSLSWKRDIFYIDIPKTSILTFIDSSPGAETKPGLFFLNQGYVAEANFLKFCKNPIKGLSIKYEKNPKVIKFEDKVVTYPNEVAIRTSKISITAQELCVSGSGTEDFYLSIEESPLIDFRWTFNSIYHYPIEGNPDFLYMLPKKSDYYGFPFGSFENIRKQLEVILISVQKEMDTEFSTRAILLKPNGTLNAILSQKEREARYRIFDIDDYEKTTNPMSYAKRDKTAIDRSILRAEEYSYLDFPEMPKKLRILKSDLSSHEFDLKDGIVTYLSKEEVVYAYYNSLSSDCTPIIQVPSDNKDERSIKLINKGIIEIICINFKSDILPFSYQLKPNEKGLSLGLSRVINQSKPRGKNRMARLVI